MKPLERTLLFLKCETPSISPFLITWCIKIISQLPHFIFARTHMLYLNKSLSQDIRVNNSQQYAECQSIFRVTHAPSGTSILHVQEENVVA